MVTLQGGYEHALVLERPPTSFQTGQDSYEIPERQTLHFQFDQYKLLPSEQGKLEGFVTRIGPGRIENLRIEAHTDDQGPSAYNVRLSERRASEVRRFAERLGVPADNISAIGYGESMPAESNSTETGRAANRRAELEANKKE